MPAKINDQISVSEQIALSQIKELKAQGFDTVISNRPDGEEPGQPTAAEVKAAAEAEGLRFVHIPIISGKFTEDAANAFKETIATSEKTFAFCRSGTRSAGLWALANAGQKSAQEILGATKNAGYDFSMFADYLKSKEAQV